MAAQQQRLAGLGAGLVEQFGLELGLQEFVRFALINEDGAGTVYHRISNGPNEQSDDSANVSYSHQAAGTALAHDGGSTSGTASVPAVSSVPVTTAVPPLSGDQAEPRTGAVTRVVPLPDRVPTTPREQYVNDSAHHGLAIDRSGTTLCAAGTMDDYVALLDRATMRPRFLDQQTTGHYYGKPYWTTEGPGDTCWVSLSDADGKIPALAQTMSRPP